MQLTFAHFRNRFCMFRTYYALANRLIKPAGFDLKVVETVPAIKGATASAQMKPATLETGYVCQVPPFVDEGDVIRVSTETGEYLSRA